jgi:hypothetical protein
MMFGEKQSVQRPATVRGTHPLQHRWHGLRQQNAGDTISQPDASPLICLADIVEQRGEQNICVVTAG